MTLLRSIRGTIVWHTRETRNIYTDYAFFEARYENLTPKIKTILRYTVKTSLDICFSLQTTIKITFVNDPD